MHMTSYFACGSERLQSIVTSMSVQQDISGTTRTIFTNFFVHVAYDHGSVLLWQVDDRLHRLSPGRGFLLYWQCTVQHSICDRYKNGWTDRHAIWHDEWAWPVKQCVTWGDDPKGEGAVWGKTCPTSLTPLIIATSATKDKFRLNLLIYHKVRQKSISYY